MCNINIFLKTDEYNKDVSAFMQSLTAVSYDRNTDGDGVYFNDAVITSPKKINLISLSHEIKKANAIITHQRFKTHGAGKHNIQPFINDRFCFVHNGILTDFYSYNKNNSDSLNFFIKFNELFYTSNAQTDDLKITETVKTLLDEIGGSYSIAIYDKQNKALYYVKNVTTTINLYRNKNKTALVLTTTDQTAFFSLLNDKFNKYSIKDYMLYKFSIGNEITFNKLDKIKQPVLSGIVYEYGGYNYHTEKVKTADVADVKDFYTESLGILEGETIRELTEEIIKTNTLENGKVTLNAFRVADAKPCASCFVQTHLRFKELLRPFCFSCIDALNDKVKIEGLKNE